MAICIERHRKDPNLHTHSGTIRLLGRHPTIVFVQGFLSLLGDRVPKQREWACMTQPSHLSRSTQYGWTLTAWLEDAQCLGPSQSLAPWT